MSELLFSLIHFLEKFNHYLCLQAQDARYSLGLVLYTLDRLYRAVEKHAKITGEWSWLVTELFESFSPLGIQALVSGQLACISAWPGSRLHVLSLAWHETWEAKPLRWLNLCHGLACLVFRGYWGGNWTFMQWYFLLNWQLNNDFAAWDRILLIWQNQTCILHISWQSLHAWNEFMNVCFRHWSSRFNHF